MNVDEKTWNSLKTVKTNSIDLDFLIPNLSEETLLQERIIKNLYETGLNSIAKAVNTENILSEIDVVGVIYRMADLFGQLQFEQDLNGTVNGIIKDDELKVCLFFLVKASAKELLNFVEIESVASRAISYLNNAKTSFTGMNLSGIHIPGADLSGAILDNASLENAVLSNVILTGAWLHGINLQNAFLNNVTLGEYPSFILSKEVHSCCFSPNGKLLAVTQYKNIHLYDNQTHVLLKTLEGHTNQVNSVHFSPDGRWLASGSWDNTVRIWNVLEERLERTLEGHTEFVTSVHFSFDGRWLASGSWDKTIKLWNVLEGRVEHTFMRHIYNISSVQFSPDGRWLASGSLDGAIKVWNVLKRQLERTLEDHTGGITSIQFSLDGRWLASGSLGGSVKLWNVLEGRVERTLEGHTDDVESVQFSPDGRWLASGSIDSTIRVWQVMGIEKESCCIINLSSNANSLTFKQNAKEIFWRVDMTIKV